MGKLKVLASLVLSAILFCNCSTKESYDGSYDVVYKGDFVRINDLAFVLGRDWDYRKIAEKDAFVLKKYTESNCYKLETIDKRLDLGKDIIGREEHFEYISICLGKKRNAKKTLLGIRDNMKNRTEEFCVSNLEFSLIENIEEVYEIMEDSYKNVLFSEEEYQKLKHDVVYYVKDMETNNSSVYIALDMLEEMIEKID